MKKGNLVGREKELGFLASSLSSSGHLRAGLITGAHGMGKTALLEAIEKSLLGRDDGHLLLSPKVNDSLDPLTFCTSLVRTARSDRFNTSLGLHKFARTWGSRVVELAKNKINSTEEDSGDGGLAEAWVKILEESIQEHGVQLKSITPVIIIDDLGQYPDDTIDWLTDSFNQTIRQSDLFKKARFLFTSETHDERTQGVFDRFGFDKVQLFALPPLSPAHCEKLAELNGYRIMGGQELRQISTGNPLKLLNIFKKSTSLPKPKSKVMSERKKKVLPHFSEFSEEEFNHLLFASYLNRINRYNLEFLCSPRDAAFCYNWLKRQKKIARKEPNGDLTLDPEIRDQIQEFHRQDKPEEAERLNVIATILEGFSSLFPNQETHWVAVNLQALDCFTKDLCRKLFSQPELSDVLSFIENHEADFNITGNQYSLNSDAKLLTQRFMEIGGGSCKEGLVEKARHQWDIDQKEAAEKRKLAEQEQLNLAEEALDIENQIESFKFLKTKAIEDFKNPAKAKASRAYSFGNNKFLVVIGLVTIAASLLSDSFGTLYAACGILFALLGFFWPNVETVKPATATVGVGPKLAIETQQRSMDYRINGLSSRAASIKANLHNLSDELESLNQGLDVPYVPAE
jgi:hypothetical protein